MIVVSIVLVQMQEKNGKSVIILIRFGGDVLAAAIMYSVVCTNG